MGVKRCGVVMRLFLMRLASPTVLVEPLVVQQADLALSWLAAGLEQILSTWKTVSQFAQPGMGFVPTKRGLAGSEHKHEYGLAVCARPRRFVASTVVVASRSVETRLRFIELSV